MISGDYTEDQFHACARHMSSLREQNSDIGLHMLTLPTEQQLRNKLIGNLEKRGLTVKQISARDFMSWNITNTICTVN
jgi:hypothetical protein